MKAHCRYLHPWRAGYNGAMKTFLAFLLWLPALPAAAISVDVHIGKAQVMEGRAENVALQMQSGADHDWRQWTLTVQAPRLIYKSAVLEAPRFDASLHARDGQWQVDEATLRARFGGSHWQLAAQTVQLSRLLSGESAWPPGMKLQLQGDGDKVRAWFAEDGGKLQLRLGAEQMSAWLKAAGIALPQGKGMALSELSLSRNGARWQVQGRLVLQKASWSSADARFALENGEGALNFTATGAGGAWIGDFDVRLERGEALFSPLYFNLGETPLALSGRWQWGKGMLRLTDVHFVENEAHAELAASLKWPEMTLAALQVHQASGDADAIYRRYARPFLADTAFADAELKGSLFAGVDWRNGQLRDVSLVFNHVDIVDKQGRFALHGLDGQLGKQTPSRIRAQASTWHRLPIGGWEAELRWLDDGVHLQKPLRVPVLDGAVVIERLEPVGAKDYRLDARIEPIDLRRFAQALDLPAFDGEVSGDFRHIRFNREGLRLLQPVLVRIFGGEVRIHDLRVEALLSAQPLLYFGLDIDKLDLRRLTNFLQIADIQGNISGEVRDVQLVNWDVKRFSAAIQTSADRPGKRSISHEAVQYLSAAGGGSAMVGKFVRILSAFPYERLGFVARLERNVLTLGGVQDADDGGYYLVKGRGLPQLNIIGYERRVDWPELLRRLDAARHTDSAVVE